MQIEPGDCMLSSTCSSTDPLSNIGRWSPRGERTCTRTHGRCGRSVHGGTRTHDETAALTARSTDAREHSAMQSHSNGADRLGVAKKGEDEGACAARGEGRRLTVQAR